MRPRRCVPSARKTLADELPQQLPCRLLQQHCQAKAPPGGGRPGGAGSGAAPRRGMRGRGCRCSLWRLLRWKGTGDPRSSGVCTLRTGQSGDARPWGFPAARQRGSPAVALLLLSLVLPPGDTAALSSVPLPVVTTNSVITDGWFLTGPVRRASWKKKIGQKRSRLICFEQDLIKTHASENNSGQFKRPIPTLRET